MEGECKRKQEETVRETDIDFSPFLCYDNQWIMKYRKGYFHGRHV